MIDYGLEPELPPQAVEETRRLRDAPVDGLRDLRRLPWSSIDNDESKDLDQLEVTVEDGDGVRLLIAVADVDALVTKGSALDDHARANTTSVYTTARIFPMLPETLSDGPDVAQRRARIARRWSWTCVSATTAMCPAEVYRAAVRNHAKLTYPAVAAWLEGDGPAPAALGAYAGPRTSAPHAGPPRPALRARREQEGALDFDRAEIKPVMGDGAVKELQVDDVESRPRHDRELHDRRQRRHRSLPDLAWLGVDPAGRPRAETLAAHRGDRGRARHHAAGSARRARARGVPARPRRQAEPDVFADLSLSVLKLLGRGEYIADGPGGGGRSALRAWPNPTTRTRPRRTARFPDLVTQRLVKAALGQRASSLQPRRADAARGALHQAGRCRQQSRTPRSQVGRSALAGRPNRPGVRRRRDRRLGEGHLGPPRFARRSKASSSEASKVSTSAIASGSVW